MVDYNLTKEREQMTKKTRKIWAILLCITMVLTSMSVISFAESSDTEAPESEENFSFDLLEEGEPNGEPSVQTEAPVLSSTQISGKATAATAELAWTCTPTVEGGVLGYKVRLWEGESDFDTETTKNLANVTSPKATNIKVSGINVNKKYSYQLGAYLEGDESATVAWSEKATLDTGVGMKAAEVTKVSGGNEKDNLITVKFSEGTGVGKYVLLTGSSTTNLTAVSTKYIVSQTSTSFKYHQQCSGARYYAVRAYSSSNSSVYIDSNAMKGGSVGSNLIFGSVVEKMQWRATIKKTTTLYKNATGSAKIGKIKKKTKTTAVGYTPSKIKNYNTPKRIKVKLSNGKVGWVKYSCVRLKALTNVKKDYPQSVKEEYANKYSSKTSYLVWVNQYTQRYTLFKKDDGKFEEEKTARVTTGKYYQPLRSGTGYYLSKRKAVVNRIYEDGRPYHFNYATFFNGSGYFHTRSIWSDTGKYRNKIQATPNTRGCCRMYDADAIKIYKLPLNTKVIIK